MSRAIVREAERIGASRIAMEDLRHLHSRIRGDHGCVCVCTAGLSDNCKPSWAYKAAALGIAVVNVHPAWSSQTCSRCGALRIRLKHRYSCSCGLRAHSDVNAARNHARMDGAMALSRAAVNQPDVAEISF